MGNACVPSKGKSKPTKNKNDGAIRVINKNNGQIKAENGTQFPMSGPRYIPPEQWTPRSAPYSLVYFGGVRNRAEPIRLLLNYAGIAYEDKNVNMPEWAEMKPKAPFGGLPILYTLEGKKYLCQSFAIARYFARENALMGNSNLEAAKVDMYMDGLYDLQNKFESVIGATLKGGDKEQAFADFEREYLSLFLNRYNKFLEENGTDWLVGDKVSWADIAISDYINTLQKYWKQDLLQNFPQIEQLIARVRNLPQLKAYFDSRPKPAFGF